MKPLFPAALALLLLHAPAPFSLQEAQEGEETELAHHMEGIEDALKLLRKHLKDEAGRAPALEALGDMERLSLLCKGLVPSAARNLPESERSAFVTAYRRTMVDFLQRQLELEAALLDGDADGARTAFERVREMEDSAHERFAPEDG
jgi:hypothetical protein